MKISIFVLTFPPERLGGTELATLNIAKYLSKKHEVHIFTKLDKGLKKESRFKGVYVHRIPWLKMRFFGGLIFWLKSYRILKKIKPDIIQAQNLEVGKFIYILNKFLKKPTVIWARGSDINILFENKKDSLLKNALKNADAVISLTDDMKEKIRKICNKKIFVIPNGIDINTLEVLSKNDLRKKIGFKKTEKIILYVGSLRPLKGLPYLLRAMKTINEKNKRLLIVGQIIGWEKDKEHLECIVKKLKISKFVTFVGRIPNKKVFEYMTLSDVFVLPSLSEGFPNVILEAMATGLPIIATRIGGIPEIIVDKTNGFLVDPKNPNQISEKINLLFKDEKLRKKISSNNIKEIKKYDWKNVIDELENVYLQVINNNLKKIDREEKL
jgi:glycosyltransferase involved in cell wall biosynthesis